MKDLDQPKRRLYRARRDRFIAGVAGGIGHYLGVDPTLVRVVWVVASLLFPPALLLDVLLYAVLWIVMPPEPDGP